MKMTTEETIKKIKSNYVCKIAKSRYLINEGKEEENREILEGVKEVEKEVNALRLAKRKNVDFGLINSCNDVEAYNHYVESDNEITKEEFKLLKEV